jgi:hypothetical protein
VATDEGAQALGAQVSPPETGQEARKGKRSRVLFKAMIHSQFGQAEARIRDLSRLGALIEMDVPPPLGAEVMFVRGSICAAGRVAWAGGQRAGLQFDGPIDEKEIVAQGTARSEIGRLARYNADPRRPPVQQFRLTAQERKLAQVWASQMGLSFEE